MNKVIHPPHRQICGLCHRVDPVMFWVPDHIWKSVVHANWQNSIVCLMCFIERADEKLIAWDKEIKFHPVSMRTQLGITLKNSLDELSNVE